MNPIRFIYHEADQALMNSNEIVRKTIRMTCYNTQHGGCKEKPIWIARPPMGKAWNAETRRVDFVWGDIRLVCQYHIDQLVNMKKERI